jgi:hypothetical protein
MPLMMKLGCKLPWQRNTNCTDSVPCNFDLTEMSEEQYKYVYRHETGDNCSRD